MNKYSRVLPFAAVVLSLTPLGGVCTFLQTFPWMNGPSSVQQRHATIHVHNGESFQSMDFVVETQTCAALFQHLMMEDSHKDSQDPVRCDANSFLDNSYTPIDVSYRTNTTQYQHGQHDESSHHHDHSQQLQQGSRSLHQREQQQQQTQTQLHPRIFHVRNHGFYSNHLNHHSNHVLLLSWTLFLLLGLLVPVFALLHDAYLRITFKSRHQNQLQAIQKALTPYKRKVLTKSQAKETCPICLSHFCMGESILTCGSSKSKSCAANAGCSHCFHQGCMVQWLFQQTKHQPNRFLVETILSNEPAMSRPSFYNKTELEAPCPCCRQPFVTVPLVR